MPVTSAAIEHGGPVPALGGLSAALRHELETLMVAREYPERSLLFAEGRPATGIFIVRSGRVKLTMESSNGRRMVVEMAGPGEVLGLSASISGKPSEVTAETLSTCRVSFINRPEFITFLEKHPGACLQISLLLSDELGAAYERVRTLRQR
jgi:CRP/FNR family transcriptional regulator, cyclic AMP receptor protein